MRCKQHTQQTGHLPFVWSCWHATKYGKYAVLSFINVLQFSYCVPSLKSEETNISCSFIRKTCHMKPAYQADSPVWFLQALNILWLFLLGIIVRIRAIWAEITGRVWNKWNLVSHFMTKIVTVMFAVDHVDGVRLHLWTAATNRPTVHPPGNIWVWRAMVEWYWQGKLKR
jgi:hypothetical protein